MSVVCEIISRRISIEVRSFNFKNFELILRKKIIQPLIFHVKFLINSLN